MNVKIQNVIFISITVFVVGLLCGYFAIGLLASNPKASSDNRGELQHPDYRAIEYNVRAARIEAEQTNQLKVISGAAKQIERLDAINRQDAKRIVRVEASNRIQGNAIERIQDAAGEIRKIAERMANNGNN